MRNINQWLVQITPGRTLEAIKGVYKSARHRELLADLQLEACSRELLERTTAGPGPGAPDEHPNYLPPAPPPPDHTVEWAAEVRDAIQDLSAPDGIDIFAIKPGSPTRRPEKCSMRSMPGGYQPWRDREMQGQQTSGSCPQGTDWTTSAQCKSET